MRLPDPVLRQALRYQLRRAQRAGLTSMIREAAEKAGIPVEFALAVASRETGIRNIFGDGGYGVGVMQIDTRSHKIAREAKAAGTWRIAPLPLIEYGCALLKGNITWAREMWSTFTADQHMKIAAAAYNAGRGPAAGGVAHGDCDRHTTGRDYGADVLRRMALFEALL